MKNLYAIALLVFCSLTSNAQNVNFADSSMKIYLVNNATVDTDNDDYPDAYVDVNHDGEIQVTEATAVTSLYINYFNATFGIVDIDGIQEFSNLKLFKSNVMVDYSAVNSLSLLEVLDISSANITSLSLSGLVHLKSFICSNGRFVSLNLSGLPSLETFLCRGNDLTSLNLTGLTSLKTLDCAFNQLSSLNVSNQTNLIDLKCGYNLFTTLDLSQNINLENFECNKFNGTSMNFPALPLLKTVRFTGDSLLSVDVTQLNALEDLSCPFSTNLNVLTLGNKPFLKTLYCSGGNIDVLDISNASNLENIYCTDNNLTALNLANKPNLIYLSCENNQITSLNIAASTNLGTLSCQNNQITALNIAADTNLTTLNCSNNLLTNLDVSNLTQLTHLNCGHNQLSNLDVANLIHLALLDCSSNMISTLNTTNLTSLYYLIFNDNLISSIDLSNMIVLDYLNCANNDFTSLSISHLHKLEDLNCSGNQLSTLELPTMVYFYSNHGSVAHSSYDCSNNLFTTLDFSPISCNRSSIRFGGNPNLTYVNIKNSGTYYNVYDMENCPNLNYICINAYPENISNPYGGIFQYIDDQTLLNNIQINPYCSFTPGGIYNTITGTFSMDIDNNGCDANDFHFSDSKIVINIPSVLNATYTNTTGNYNFYTHAGDFVITPEFEHPYFTVSPASATISFAESNNSVQTQDFCVIPNGVHNDIEIVLIPINRARPGFNAHYKLIYKNKGNQTLSGSINLAFDDAVLDFVSADPALSNQTLNTLNWNYNNLIPFESKSIDFTLNVNSPMETPAVNIGDVLNFNATINPIAGDETIVDNTFALAQTVVGSYDPNDKTCLEGNTMTPEMVGGYLHYMIRFQNSGTAAAENIVVKDIIDTTKFDIASLQLTSSSHPQVTKITGNKVEFQFENINLPAGIDDEPGSHGYVAFKIKTKNNLVLGNSVSNKADIYFDYNFPIETNTATSTVALLGVNTFENTSVNVTPNPTKNIVHITSKGNITSIQLFDVQGRLLETVTANAEQVDFDLNQKTSGVYFVKIYTVKGMKTEKVVKE
ncbi:T9SS type A sorting domain-containing protein [Flavobacterium sp.]|uniref:DUF7619 domain-containing protein n=1 Tax=Flavobacterium sp. TaxID=239 RepID=UPI00286C335D|nr:T9SS type A sorting domain-containing protein [Flavobacterium sp.]